MIKRIMVLAVSLLLLSGCGAGKRKALEPWIKAKDTLNEYLSSRYDDVFKYEEPYITNDVDGTGKRSDGYFYVKTLSTEYPKMDMMTNYIRFNDDGSIDYKDSYQSARFAYEVESELNEWYTDGHARFDVDSLEWDENGEKVYSSSEEYYSNPERKDTVIYLYIEEDYLNPDLRNSLMDTSKLLPSGMNGKIRIFVVNSEYQYKKVKSIPRGYCFGNWNNVTIPVADGKFVFEQMEEDSFAKGTSALMEYLK